MFLWLSHEEPAFPKGAACKLKGKACVENGSVALKMPPSQGDSGCPANLVEFFSWRHQLSAREDLSGAPVTWQADHDPTLILLSAAEETTGREDPRLQARGQSPPAPRHFRIVERAQ